MIFLRLLSSAALACAVASQRDIFDKHGYQNNQLIVRDVAVLGGGASGTFAAINLRKLGKSVVVIEKENILGGHTNTYKDAASGTTFDYGVQAYLNNSVTRDFFNHFNIPVGPFSGPPRAYRPADFATGQPVANFNPSQDLTAWAAQLDKYPWIDQTWDVPQPVESDLLLPLQAFIKKYKLESIGYYLYFGAEGLSNALQQVTINVMKMVDRALIDERSGQSLWTTRHNNGEVYEKAAQELGADVLLSSTVFAARRNSSGVALVVKTPQGYKLVIASKLLVTVPTVMDNMQPMNVDQRETAIFSKWNYLGYYVMVVRNTGLPSGFTWINANNSVETYNIPQLPGLSEIFESRIPGLFYAWFRSPTAVTQAEVEKTSIETMRRIQAAQNFTATTPEILEFRSHSPYKLYVNADDIRNGFYQDLYRLQGYRSTWYTGAAMVSHNVGLTWDFTQRLLPKMIAA